MPNTKAYTVANAGLALIKTQTIGTGVSSVAVTGVFSSAYDNYLIVVGGGVLSGANNLQLQLGSTTTGYYEWGIYGGPSSATVTGLNTNNGSNFQYVVSGSTGGCYGVATLIGPNLAAPTAIVYDSIRSSSSRIVTHANGSEDSTTQHTAFTFICSAGTATGGTIKVYGYKNS